MRTLRFRLLLVVASALAAPLGAEVVTHHLNLRFVGLIGPYAGPLPACPGSPRNGYDSYEGDLSGDEAEFATEQQVDYRGKMKRTTKIGVCDLLPEDEDGVANYCNTNLTIEGTYRTELEVHSDRAEVYFTMEPVANTIRVSATGSCDAQLTGEIRDMYLKEGDGIEHLVGKAQVTAADLAGGPLRPGTYPPTPPSDPQSVGYWTLVVGAGDTLRAVPGGPYSVVRAAEVVLDGSASTGRIRDYLWTLQPESCPIWAAPVTVRGARVRLKPLCPVKATLEVRGDSGSDAEETAVAIVVRPWKTKVPKPITGWLEGERLVKPCGCNYGRNICAKEYAQIDANGNRRMSSDGHRLHRDLGAITYEKTGFELGEHSDPSGLFDRWWYVAENLLEMPRAELLNVELAPGGILDQENRPAQARDLDALIAAVRAHESTHTGLLREQLGRDDPAKEIETLVQLPGKRDELLQRADDTILRAETALIESDNEAAIIARLLASGTFGGSATILQRVAQTQNSWDAVTHPVLAEAAGD